MRLRVAEDDPNLAEVVVGIGKVVKTRVAMAAVGLLSPLDLVMAAAAGDPAPTFTAQVAPILFRHCVGCHRPGQIGGAQPLDSYATSKPLAAAIKEQALKHLMPPWSADPAHSAKFSNDPRLSQQEIDMLVAWADAGAPQGNDADLPPLPALPTGWLNPNGKPPDAVVTLPTVQAGAGLETARACQRGRAGIIYFARPRARHAKRVEELRVCLRSAFYGLDRHHRADRCRGAKLFCTVRAGT
jgi:mono/diheme cytochrome c family protein